VSVPIGGAPEFQLGERRMEGGRGEVFFRKGVSWNPLLTHTPQATPAISPVAEIYKMPSHF